MSPLTKALTVIVTVLACVLVALVVPFVAKTENAQQEVKDLNLQLRSAQATISTQDRLLALANQQQTSNRVSESQQVAALQSQLDNFRAMAEAADQRSLIATNEKAKLQAELESLGVTFSSTGQLLSTTLDAGQAKTQEIAQLERQLAEVDNALSRAVAERERMEDDLRYYQEQLVDVQAQLAAAGTGSTQVSSSPAPADLTGAVTDVAQRAGLTFVTIDLGRNDGLAAGNELLIARDELVGFLTLSEVNASSAIGQVSSMNMLPQAGDRVLSR